MVVLSRILTWTLFLVLTLAPMLAHAAPTQSDKDKARALIIQGRQHLDAGEPARALPLLKEAHDIMHVPTTALDLMRAYGDLNKLAEARAVGEEAQHMPVLPNEPEAYRDAREQVKQANEALDTQIPLLELTITGAPLDKVQVTVDRRVVPPGEIDKPIRINPGESPINVFAPNCGSFEATQKADSGLDRRYKLKVHLSCQEPPPKPEPPVIAVKPEPPKADNRMLVAGFISGAAFVAAGTGLTIAAKSANEQAIDAASPGCVDQCRRIYDAQYPRSTVLTASAIPAFAVGGGLVVTTLVYWGMKRSTSETPKTNVSAMIAPGIQGVLVQGMW